MECGKMEGLTVVHISIEYSIYIKITNIFFDDTIMILNFRTILGKGLHCLPFHLFLFSKTFFFKFKDNYCNFSGVRNFRILRYFLFVLTDI